MGHRRLTPARFVENNNPDYQSRLGLDLNGGSRASPWQTGWRLC